MINPESLSAGIGKKRLYYCSIALFLLGGVSLYTSFNGTAPVVVLFGVIQLFSALLAYCLFFARTGLKFLFEGFLRCVIIAGEKVCLSMLVSFSD